MKTVGAIAANRTQGDHLYLHVHRILSTRTISSVQFTRRIFQLRCWNCHSAHTLQPHDVSLPLVAFAAAAAHDGSAISKSPI